MNFLLCLLFGHKGRRPPKLTGSYSAMVFQTISTNEPDDNVHVQICKRCGLLYWDKNGSLPETQSDKVSNASLLAARSSNHARAIYDAINEPTCEKTSGEPKKPTICAKCDNPEKDGLDGNLTGYCKVEVIDLVYGHGKRPLCKDKNHGNCGDFESKDGIN
jgi:hypothetical protein